MAMIINTNIDDEWSSFLMTKVDDETSEDDENNTHNDFNED